MAGMSEYRRQMIRLNETKGSTWEREMDLARQRAMDRGLSFDEAEIVIGVPPKRGTMAWERRELLRRRAGCACISLGGNVL